MQQRLQRYPADDTSACFNVIAPSLRSTECPLLSRACLPSPCSHVRCTFLNGIAVNRIAQSVLEWSSLCSEFVLVVCQARLIARSDLSLALDAFKVSF